MLDRKMNQWRTALLFAINSLYVSPQRHSTAGQRRRTQELSSSGHNTQPTDTFNSISADIAEAKSTIPPSPSSQHKLKCVEYVFR